MVAGCLCDSDMILAIYRELVRIYRKSCFCHPPTDERVWCEVLHRSTIRGGLL